MAFSTQFISVLMCLMSFQNAINAHPYGTPANRPRSSSGPAPQGLSLARTAAKLSPSCQLAASGLLGDEFESCADILGLVSIFEAKDSLVSPINTWVSGACSAKPCSKQSLDKASQMMKTGCASDLQEGSIAAVAMYSILTHYDVTRDMFCTQYKQNSTYCLPSVLGDVESQSGEKITLGEVVSLITGKLTKADRAFMSVPKETYCTPCGHAIVTKSATMIDAIRKDPVGIEFNYSSSSTVHQISEICGAAFEDHQIPDSVQIAPPPKSGNPIEKKLA
ncbi:hypothetical protein PGT21_017736 [Puccinia graminis f. sp. tritici]|uniref:DUF7729 domain-containing protein n=1 Tax=Puccinia graminis f. sp. tritici TaxID=56615 RepID=A0A5B0RRY8_PUCGR|nr:hypothetical protein PGT21_017736 [Puccinia graminis f. sp. tritici]KAA1105168.1 hypothetical protein PGTUg99_000768 [Puccinia graminis f. sp. tritici]KAA1127623.1 hypothetical protein PGTUg99_003777 [Puccinia graminis f. sp. tritici]